MNIKHLFVAVFLCGFYGIVANAQTVILDENFDNDYTNSFPYVFDGDGLMPHSSIASVFYSNVAESYMPWWIVKDSNSSPDRFMASHSYYSNPGKSSDWLISMPLEITTKGFILSFDAQSVPVRSSSKLSDLSLYITTELIDPANLPTTPTQVWRSIPYGNDIDNCENDWTTYTYSLDKYVGHTIYLNFVNENTDNDILCLDHVKVYREDIATLTIDNFNEYTTDGSATIGATLTAIADVTNWNVTLEVDGTAVRSWNGAQLANGATQHFDAQISLKEGEQSAFSFALTADNSSGYIVGGSITRMAFTPVHRVFLEESTSLHCGNCPMGAYAIESLLNDPDYGDRVVPVSVHISAMGFDPMVDNTYANALSVSSAPLVFVNRDPSYDGFIPAYDLNYDPTNPDSFAYRIRQHILSPTCIDLNVDASWGIVMGDTTSVRCIATVRPAYNLRNKDYRVAFILTENNVGLDNNQNWIQENYLSGTDVESRAGGWCDLPKYVVNARFHDVARRISSFWGEEGSLPQNMDMNREYTHEVTMMIPNTYQENGGMTLSPAIQRQFCEISAIVIDNETGRVVNAARVPMSDVANNRFTAADLAAAGVEDVISDSASDSEDVAEYYDLAGRRVAKPAHGIYIRRTPARTSKIIIK